MVSRFLQYSWVVQCLNILPRLEAYLIIDVFVRYNVGFFSPLSQTFQLNCLFKKLICHGIANAGERAAIFLGPVPEDKLPKDATPGRILVGSLSLSKKESGSGDAPGKVSLSYRCLPVSLPEIAQRLLPLTQSHAFACQFAQVPSPFGHALAFPMRTHDQPTVLQCSVPPKKENGAGKDAADKSSKAEEKDKEKPKTSEERLREAVRDAQVHQLIVCFVQFCAICQLWRS
jgi:hypothetical protein